MAFFSWSKTASNNGAIDSTINFQEGQSPSSVNDSARAVMARLAEYRDDVSGLLTTGGTSTAYTLTTNEGLAATPIDGQLIAFTPHVTNGVSATLVTDGGTAYALQSAPGSAIPAGSIVQGTPYTAKFLLASNAWIMRNFYGGPFNVPLGTVLIYTGDTAPNSNFALAYGQAISRTTYASYFALVGTRYGVGDGSTTFNIPDLRDRAVFGLGNMGGVAAGRISVAGGNYDSTVNGATGGLQNHTLTTAELAVHSHGGTNAPLTASGTTGTESAFHTHTGTTSGVGDHTHLVNDAPSKVGTFTGGGSNGWAGNSSVASGGAGAHSHTVFNDNNTTTHTHNFTTNSFTPIFTGSNAGSGAAHTIMPPAISLPMIVRIF